MMSSSYPYGNKKGMFSSRNMIENRFNRAEKQKESRKNQRANNFNANRNLAHSSPKINSKVQSIPKNEDRLSKLTKWKAIREKQKRLDQAKKKPPFIVGMVHHKIYSPVSSSLSAISTKKRDATPKKITNVTEKKLMAKVSAGKVNTKGLLNESKILTKGQRIQRKHGRSSISDNFRNRSSYNPLIPKVVIEKLSPVKISPSVTKIQRAHNKNRRSSTKDSSIVLNRTFSNESMSPRNSKIQNNSTAGTISPSNGNSPMLPGSKSPRKPMLMLHRISNHKDSNIDEKQQLQYNSSLSHSTNGIPAKDTVVESLNISFKGDKLSTQYFQFLLNKETERLNILCEKWMKIKTAPETPEDGQYQINQAIGQTNLLMTKKFEKFHELINDCETGEGEMLVTCKDLQGFWEMMYMEVENCNSRFEKLEKLRVQGWKEEDLPKVFPKKKTIVKKKVVSNKPSTIKAFLAEKKKKIAEKVRNDGVTNERQSNLNQVVNNKFEKDRSHNLKRKTKSMFSENKATLMKHDKRLSLVQKIQLPQRSRKIDSPLTIMKISRMCKTPKGQLNNFEAYAKSNRTPGKSILKQRKSPTKAEYPEFTDKVNLADCTVLNEVSVDEKTEAKKDLVVIMPKVNISEQGASNCFDQVSVHVKKKLAFEDESFEEPISNMEQNMVKGSFTNKKIHKLPSIHIQPPTPLQESNKNVITRRRSTRRQNIAYKNNQMINQTSPLNINISMLFKDTDDADDTDFNESKKEIQKNIYVEYNDSIKVLRNRIVTPMHTPIVTRRSRKVSINIQDVNHKENKTPVSRRRTRNASQDNIDDNKGIDTADSYNDITYSEKDSSKRRSTRHIKFSEECYGCTPNKLTLPVTPYVRRSKAHSNNKEESNTYTKKDSVSLEIEKKPSERIRRSQAKKVQSLT